MIKIRKKKVIKEAELAGTPASSTIAPPNTSDEKTTDDQAKTLMLNKFANEIPDTKKTIDALKADFKNITGDQKQKSLAQFLSSIEIDKQTVQSTINKMNK
jgi:hypothetical protein